MRDWGAIAGTRVGQARVVRPVIGSASDGSAKSVDERLPALHEISTPNVGIARRRWVWLPGIKTMISVAPKKRRLDAGADSTKLS